LLNAQRIPQDSKSGESNSKEYTWVFDVMLTNTGKTSITVSPSDFTMLDTTGWLYSGCRGLEKTPIGPNQSQEVMFKFENVGQFARPAEIGTSEMSLNMTLT
jgi:hypothetical protein